MDWPPMPHLWRDFVLFGISATDPRTMAGVPLLLLAVAAVACLVPGRRAARLDPAEILRHS